MKNHVLARNIRLAGGWVTFIPDADSSSRFSFLLEEICCDETELMVVTAKPFSLSDEADKCVFRFHQSDVDESGYEAKIRIGGKMYTMAVDRL